MYAYGWLDFAGVTKSVCVGFLKIPIVGLVLLDFVILTSRKLIDLLFSVSNLNCSLEFILFRWFSRILACR